MVPSGWLRVHVRILLRGLHQALVHDSTAGHVVREEKGSGDQSADKRIALQRRYADGDGRGDQYLYER